MSKIILLFSIVILLMLLFNTQEVLAQDEPTTCSIDVSKGEFFCTEGICISLLNRCENYHPWYDDYYKDDSTGCEYQPKSPPSHYETAQGCIPPDQSAPVFTPQSQCPTGFSPPQDALGNYQIGGACVLGSAPNPPPVTTCAASNHYQCPSGLKCTATTGFQSGYCLPAPPVTPPCDIDSDCRAGQKCQTTGSFTTKRCVVVIPTGPIALAGGYPCGTTDNPGFKTAIGCIHTNPAALVKDVLKFGLGIGGGLAFLMMLLGAFQMLTSAGNPETLATGKDRLTSAVIGLLFVIFSVLLLQIIGFGILKIPGFE